MILYFSATGNCKYVAKRIANEFDDAAVSIEDHDGNVKLKEGEMLGFVTPVYWWELPTLTREFLQRLSVMGPKPAYSFIVTTYGTTPGCTYTDARRILATKGIELNTGLSVKMPDTWTPIFDLSNAQEVARQNEEAEGYIDDALAHIRQRDTGNLMQHKKPCLVRVFADPFYNRERQTKNFHLEGQCIGCGLCARKCPVQAIEMVEKRPMWVKDLCALCLRCLHHCPKFAIQYGNGKTKQHGQYKNPHVRV